MYIFGNQHNLSYTNIVVVYTCFSCGNRLSNNAPMCCHFACSLKNEDVGYCGKLSGVRESWLFAESAGGGGGR